MIGRGPMFETLTEFFDRRFRELVKVPKFAKMDVMELVDMVEDEYYYWADDQISPEADRTLQ